MALREPLRYESVPCGVARAKPASSRSRSRSSNDCNHHLSKSIRRVYIGKYCSRVTNQLSLCTGRLHPRAVVCSHSQIPFPFLFRVPDDPLSLCAKTHTRILLAPSPISPCSTFDSMLARTIGTTTTTIPSNKQTNVVSCRVSPTTTTNPRNIYRPIETFTDAARE